MKKLWPELRNLIGKQLALNPHESGNEIWPDMLFDSIDGIDRNDFRDLRKDVISIFGMNGTPPPIASMGQFVSSWEKEMKLWLFRYDFGESEAAAMIHDFLDR